MIQGTASNAGKSVLNAAFCRILLQDGLKVAPFKAQNMSLNSFVTRDGGEMGRAQVTQAQACRIEPDVRMNPVLLKPNSHTGSQIILEGKPIGNMDAKHYFEYKKLAAEKVHHCYDSLAAEYDAVILEGAGSPAEVNLKKHDIVNMKMARYAQAPVLLAGDIDRGGLFAAFIGTMQTLNHWERELVAGFLINRFRGDASLLGDAMAITRTYTGKPTLGVIPFIRQLNLPEEDSVTFKNSIHASTPPTHEHVSIMVIDLPHISNFTDLDALAAEPDVFLQVIDCPQPQYQPDAVIIPGSKNVIHDLDFLKKTGLADWVVQLAENSQAQIIGICGGFQMLGKTIYDPFAVESSFQSAQGLSLLNLSTTLAKEKTLTRTTAHHDLSGCSVTGYEIHHGQTTGTAEAILKNSEKTCGFASENRQVWGTYLHGVFDADQFRRYFVDQLRIQRQLPPLKTIQTVYDIDQALDRLAAIVREAVDMKQIYQIMGL
jgi:cobyric acid synthase CobQ